MLDFGRGSQSQFLRADAFGLSWAVASLLFALALATGCTVALSGIPAGAIVGRPAAYDYSPSVIQSGNILQIWWCGLAPNPNKGSQVSDAILYATVDRTTGTTSKWQAVMGETPGAWDSMYTCNPRVVAGSFANPLGDGATYSYAMYYVATGLRNGLHNSIGVAFSNDGVHWKKYPQPVIVASTQVNYGLGQPAVTNSDRKSGIRIFYEDNCDSSDAIKHVEATSTDGVHFQVAGTLTTNGLNPRSLNPTWGDMAYDPVTDVWYAAFNMDWRHPSTTGNQQERGQPGIVLYRIPAASLLTGATPWEELHTFDTNSLGYESNFIASFLRDPYGNINIGPYPAIELFTSVSNQRPAWDASPAEVSGGAVPESWDIGHVSWTPGQPMLALKQYNNKKVREATTGWVDPNGGFSVESTAGALYEAPRDGATLAFYGCKGGAQDYFISTDSACEGQRTLGVQGYGYSHLRPDLSLQPLYRCSSGHDHFVSTDAKCGGESASPVLLGYMMRQ
jgi:hypothetical protein